MRAMFIEAYGGPEQLVLKNLPVPVPAPDEVLIRVQALGINRAETYFRRGAWGDVVRVSGIECVGVVEDDPSGRLPKGRTVAAIMGGLGRTRNGSYAEFTAAPAANVIPLQTTLSWPELAAIPESYATAWGALFDIMSLEPDHVVLIRGATSALGQAAVSIASDYGATVLATTRRPDRVSALEDLGASRVLIDHGVLANEVHGIDGVLDIVGNRVLRDSLRMLKKNGTLCEVGFLGGMEPVEHFNPLLDMPSGVNLRFYGTGLVLGNPDFPLAAIPMQRIVEKVASGAYKTKPARVFPFEAIQDAHRLMESDEAWGKIVMTV